MSDFDRTLVVANTLTNLLIGLLVLRIVLSSMRVAQAIEERANEMPEPDHVIDADEPPDLGDPWALPDFEPEGTADGWKELRQLECQHCGHVQPVVGQPAAVACEVCARAVVPF